MPALSERGRQLKHYFVPPPNTHAHVHAATQLPTNPLTSLSTHLHTYLPAYLPAVEELGDPTVPDATKEKHEHLEAFGDRGKQLKLCIYLSA